MRSELESALQRGSTALENEMVLLCLVAWYFPSDTSQCLCVPGMVTHSCNARVLGTAMPAGCLMWWTHACNPSAMEAKVGGSEVQDQLRLHIKTLYQNKHNFF